MNIKAICKGAYLGARQLLLKLISAAVKKPPGPSTVGAKSVLAVRIDRIGDLVVSLAALKHLRNVFPAAKIAVLTTRQNSALLNVFPWIDEVIVYQGFMPTLQLLRKKGFDLAVDFLMDYPLRTALLVYLSKSKITAGFDIAGRGSCFNLSLRPASEKKHVGLYMLDLVQAIAKAYAGRIQRDENPAIEFLIPRYSLEKLESLLRQDGINKGDFVVVIHPGGHYASQRWPIGRFAELADKLMEKYKARIIIIGEHKEKQIIERLSGAMKEKPLKAIGWALDKIAALISLADLFIGDNSGPLHIAVTLGIPTVSTMGPTDPDLWWPKGENHIVIRKKLLCSPCNKAFCRQHECMRLISVEEILGAVEMQINKSDKIKK